MSEELAGLDLLRKPFPVDQIGKLPRVTCKDCSEKQCQRHQKSRCDECGNWISSQHIHLDYVGHAALTARLLDVDPLWTWEPAGTDERGLPALDGCGGLWIRLTVCGHSRLGYGHANGKKGGDAVKEAIGDALRNAAMRFGAALDLWHKGDLQPAEQDTEPAPPPEKTPADVIRDSIRELAVEMKWELSDLVADFAASHENGSLRDCQDVEALAAYVSQLEDVAAGQRAERNGSAA